MAPHKTVSLNSAGHPVIRIKVWGVSDAFSQEFEALLDTGFTGFLMLPLTAALPLGLTLAGTTNYSLADGSSSNTLLAFGTIDYEGQKIFGPISLESNVNCRDILVGMEFIKQGKLMLLLHSEGALLVDMEALKTQIETSPKAQSAPTQAAVQPSLPDLPPNPTTSN